MSMVIQPWADNPSLSTVKNVQLCATGIEYPAASGPLTLTEEHLRQAVMSQDDPAIVSPRVWLGHPDDERFHIGRSAPIGSAEPAMGVIKNMRLANNDQVIECDIIGMPTWLAKILPSAFPSRSIEGRFDAQTVTGHTWGLIIDNLALLGVVWPGCSTLEDIQAMYSEEGPEWAQEDELMTVQASRVNAQVNVDDVRRSYYGQLESGQTWWWIRSILVEPNELIVDDDEGGLFRVPFSVSDDEIGFEDPVAVKVEYVNASQKDDPASRALVSNTLATGHKSVAASFDNRAASRPETNDQEVNMTAAELAAMGLAPDATQAAIDERVAAIAALGTPAPAEGETTPPTVTAPEGASPSPDAPTATNTPSPDQTPVAASAAAPDGQSLVAQLQAAGMVAIPAAAWTQTQTQLQGLTARAEVSDKATRDSALMAAARDGKIFPAQYAEFQKRLDDPVTRQSYLDLITKSPEEGGLAANLVPVQARGADPSSTELQASAEAYPPGWLPELANRSENTGPITQEVA